MRSDRTELLADLVASALECAVAERAQFLSDVCGGDVALREEAESLLRFEESARDFIETPAHELMPGTILNGTSDPAAVEEPVFPSEAIIASVPDFQSPEIERSDHEEIVSVAAPKNRNQSSNRHRNLLKRRRSLLKFPDPRQASVFHLAPLSLSGRNVRW